MKGCVQSRFAAGLLAVIVAVVVWIVMAIVSPRRPSVGQSDDTPRSGSVELTERPLAMPSTEPAATEQDHVATKELERRFTDEQRRRLEEIGREYGELEARRMEAEREWTLARAQAAGAPAIAPLVAELRDARAALEQYLRDLPGRAEAERRAQAAQRRAAEAAARVEALKRHVEDHVPQGASSTSDECEWCRRDAARMAVAEARMELLRELNQELLAAGAAAREAEAANRAARVELSSLMRAARTSETARAYTERVHNAARALNDAMAAMPDVARWREDVDAALARQRELMAEWREIHRSAPLVDPATGQPVVVPSAQMAAAVADQPERVRTTP